MDKIIPAAEVRTTLAKLGHSQLQALAKTSGVSFSTLWRIREGESLNPGIETVRKFMPHIGADVSPATQPL